MQILGEINIHIITFPQDNLVLPLNQIIISQLYPKFIFPSVNISSFSIYSYSLFLRMTLSSICLLLILLPSNAMDYGRSGVYDSPMANDYYVKRFGFLFGGGRSGRNGLDALQVNHSLFPNQIILTLSPENS